MEELLLEESAVVYVVQHHVGFQCGFEAIYGEEYSLTLVAGVPVIEELEVETPVTNRKIGTHLHLCYKILKLQKSNTFARGIPIKIHL